VRAAGLVLAAVAAWLGGAAATAAQTGLPVAPTAPAPPDTATLTLASTQDVPAPVLRVVGPDSVLFGGEIDVRCVFPAAAGVVALDSLVCRVPWAELIRVETAGEGTDGGSEVALGLRLSRAGPYVLAWADGPPVGEVRHVTGRLGPDDRPSPLREPRRLGWYGWRLLLAALAAAALLWLGWRLRRRRGTEADSGDPLPPPAWMPAAIALRDLADGGLDARGEGRAFLHALDLVYRRYLAGRYHIGAVEMTPDEVAAALAQRRYAPEIPARAVAILRRCDILRFSPGEVPRADCRELLAAVIEAVARTRVAVLYTPVPPDLEIAARSSWQRLLEIAPPAEPALQGGGRV
jgi:hypothetical protein